MSTRPQDAANSKKSRDPDMISAEIAIKRAVRKVREQARKDGTTVVVLKDGKIVEERP